MGFGQRGRTSFVGSWPRVEPAWTTACHNAEASCQSCRPKVLGTFLALPLPSPSPRPAPRPGRLNHSAAL